MMPAGPPWRGGDPGASGSTPGAWLNERRRCQLHGKEHSRTPLSLPREAVAQRSREAAGDAGRAADRRARGGLVLRGGEVLVELAQVVSGGHQPALRLSGGSAPSVETVEAAIVF